MQVPISLEELRHSALDIFRSGLSAVDPRKAIQRSVALEGSSLRVFGDRFELANRDVFVIAIGKAAFSMTAGLQDVLNDRIAGAVVTGLLSDHQQLHGNPALRLFSGGHPLPNSESLEAAVEAFRLLEQANETRGLVIFLISGGGSAMMESPRNERITLDDLRDANRVLVKCGASIAEINAVRRGFSAVKGGGLAAAAPDADQLTLIVSDTNTGDEANVASGPSLSSNVEGPSIPDILRRYDLQSRLPQSVAETVASFEARSLRESTGRRAHHVLLNNTTAINAAAARAFELGYLVDIADDVIEQPIEIGARLLLAKLGDSLKRSASAQRVCLLSGGEFSCPVRGAGVGGRNLETVLRCMIDFSGQTAPNCAHFVVLSAGTDGIDGNSSAAGAICDDSSNGQAKELGLDPQRFLDESDSFEFFKHLNSLIVTGPTGTNVRDLRILLAVP